jgi:hypothetical protein
VLIQGGDYSATTQSLVDDSAKDSCANPVLIQSAPGATVTFGMIDDNNAQKGASWLALKNINLTRVVNITGGHNVTLDGVSGGTVYIGGAQHVLIENSTFGPCYSGTPVTGSCTNNFKIDSSWQYTNGGPVFGTDDITVIHNTIHNYINNAPPPNDHFECTFVRGGQDIMIDSNHIHVCQHYGIMLQPVNAGPDGIPGDNLVIQNNWIDETEDYGQTDNLRGAIDLGANTGQVVNTLIRYNSFASYDGVWLESALSGVGSGIRIYGNVGGNGWPNGNYAGSCIPGVNYGYNIWRGGTACSSTDTTVATLPYVNQTDGSEDYHLNCGSLLDVRRRSHGGHKRVGERLSYRRCRHLANR